MINCVCSNPWCKALFNMDENLASDPLANKTCPKCESFNSELSGGVEWKEKKYDEPISYNEPHQIKYKITNYK